MRLFQWRQFLGSLLIGMATSGVAMAQQNIKLTIGSHAGLTLVPIAVLKNYFEPEVDRLLKAGGNKYKIQWTEAFGGTLFKHTETLSAVGDGLADIGFVVSAFESDKMPLSSITFHTPFTSNNMRVQATAVERLVRNNKAVAAEWERNNLVYLAPIVVEPYDLWTTYPVGKVDDLQGHKLMAPGPAARWLQGTGAIAVDGGLPSYYTNLQTGVADGAVNVTTAMVGAKVHEIAKHVTVTGIGPMVSGGVAINRDRFRKLPKEVQDALSAAGAGYLDQLIKQTEAKIGEASQVLASNGIKILQLPDAQRQAWVQRLPDISGDWAKALEARSVPARQVLRAYMDEVRSAGEKPGREWDK